MEASSMKCNNLNLMPKLRKNKRIENRWGVKYHTAVKNAVFAAQPAPYMPLEPPPSLSEYITEPESLYVCKQCKDCFRFLSSFEDHNSRHSWILGFWCQHCFVTICTHMTTEGSPCSVCLKLDRDKRLYLRGRGLHKSQKLGAVRVFYNQCQFFAHLKTHHVTLVDMGDLMLMPLPTSMDNDWSPELDVTCEALMEHAFMLRVHVVDLLKAKKVENTWWQLATDKTGDDDNPVAKIVKGYKGRFFFNPTVPTTRDQFSTLNSSYSTSTNSRMSPDIEIIEHVQSNDKRKNLYPSDGIMFDSDQSVVENEDNPCTATDIAFVDCGPTSKCFEPELAPNSVLRKHTTIFVKSGPDSANTFQPANIVKISTKRKRFKSILANCNSPDIPLSYGNTTITPKRDAKDVTADPIDTRLWKDTAQHGGATKISVKTVTEGGAKKPLPEMEPLSGTRLDSISVVSKLQTGKSKSEKIKQNVHTLTVNPGKQILTFSKNVDLNAIINQLPSHLVGNKRIVVIGQDSEGVNAHSKQEGPSKKIIQVVPDTSLRKNVKSLQTKLLPLHISNDTGRIVNKDNNNKKGQLDPPASKTQLSSYPSKIVYRNGRKFVIKQMSNSAKKTTNSSNLILLATDARSVKQSASESNASTVTPTSSNESENTLAAEKILHNDVVSPLTPSPSPSELSSSSSCDVQSKQSTTPLKNVSKVDAAVPQLNFERKDAAGSILKSNESTENLSFHKGEDENLYLDIKFFNQKPLQTVADTCVMITKCKQEMLNEFFHLSHTELKKRYDHMQHVNDEILNVMTFVADNVVKENLKAVNILQHVLKHCIDKCVDTLGNASESDVLLSEWESVHATSAEKPKCSSCNKILKPKSYIPGFSAVSKDDAIYCSCYRNICHKCLTYEGNSMSFGAHRNYHEKRKPYMCPDCFRKFPSFKSLEFHTWTACFHTLKKRVLGCKICEIDGFRDMESIARHFAIMHSHNKIACDICYLVLPSYSEYKKHSKEAHSSANQEPIRLTLCKLGQCIVRYENYMPHMEKHLVVQRLAWFKCPFCPFVNLEAKRILPHFQNKHLERLPEILSPETLWDILPVDLVVSVLKANPQLSTEHSAKKFINTHEEPCEDGTILPKIINTRTITSEVFERGAQDAEEDLSSDAVNQSATKLPKKLRENGTLSATTDASDSSKIVDPKPKSQDEIKKSEALPKILEVRSMADVSPDRSQSRSNSVDTITTVSDNKKHSVLRVPLGKKNSDDAETKEEKSSVTPEKSTPEENLRHAENKSSEDGDKSSISSFSLQQFLLGSNETTSSEVEDATKSEVNSNVRNDTCGTITKPQQATDESSKEKNFSDTKQTEILEKKQLDTPVRGQKQTENTPTRSSISKPPPLARIPQHVLQRSAFKEFGAQVAKAGKDKIALQNSRTVSSISQILRRIAFSSSRASKEKGVDFSCHLCGELINTSWSVISTHYRNKHSQDHKLSVVTPKLLRMTQEFINGGYKEACANKKRKLESTPTIAKRRRRWTPKKYMESKNSDSSGGGLCVEQETAEDGEGNFRCKKCNQRCTDMADLREHIASNHRIKGRYLICLECGENFVVAPSLQMHLKAFHGIEDPIIYMARNTSYAPDNVDDLEIEGKTTIANQCHVCMAVFEDKAAVDKHLRVHGMAFLNRKRIEARNMLKSPEKKDSGAEEKRSPIKDAVKEPVRRDNPSETILEKINASI